MRSAVITIASGRPRHLARQSEGLARSGRAPEQRVVVALDPEERREIESLCPAADVLPAPRPPGTTGMPLAAARNAGAERALAGGAELLIFLDVDCIPAPELVGRYQEAAAKLDGALLCGPVSYLPPGPLDDLDAANLHRLGRPHAARPTPPGDELLRAGDHRLFWSLSFAVTARTWRRIGGFCEEYGGYGGEDTDFGQLARRADVELCWVGGAWAFHQHHESRSPALAHADDVLRNATLFHRRWGWWPMRGWLEELERAGRARYDAAGDSWVAVRGVQTRRSRGEPSTCRARKTCGR
jgi:hypothetical protein